jgi:hypothetical protein
MDDAVLTGYDVIGDVHGHVQPLQVLLSSMGYMQHDGVWGHPNRQAVFVGDLVDRGAHQVEVVRLVRAMVMAGTAQIVMGNHEYNAVAWATRDPEVPGGHLRSHSLRHRTQHQAFLDQVGESSPLHDEFVEWFRTIPLWLELELDGNCLRVVHACWHPASMDVLRFLTNDDRTLTTDGWSATSRRGSAEYDALEVVLKGPEVRLPDGIAYYDKDGHSRTKARVRWWDPTADTLRRGTLIPPGSRDADGNPFPPLPDVGYRHEVACPDDVPVIVGHYWEQVPGHLWSPKVACVDYSVAKSGPLVAYRWSGETELDVDRYVYARGSSAEDTPGEGFGDDIE